REPALWHCRIQKEGALSAAHKARLPTSNSRCDNQPDDSCGQFSLASCRLMAPWHHCGIRYSRRDIRADWQDTRRRAVPPGGVCHANLLSTPEINGKQRSNHMMTASCLWHHLPQHEKTSCDARRFSAATSADQTSSPSPESATVAYAKAAYLSHKKKLDHTDLAKRKSAVNHMK